MSFLLSNVGEASAATTIFSDNFGTGSTVTPVSGWSDGGNSGSDSEARAASSGNDSASPDGGRFAVMLGDSGYICRTINSSGYTNVKLSYQWRGDADSGPEVSDDAIVEFRSASGATCSSSGWTTLATHDMRNDSSWTTQAPITNSGMNNTSFLIRFRVSTNASDEHFRVDNVLIEGDSAIIKTNPTLSISNSPVTFTGSAQSASVNGSVAGVVSDIKYDGSSTVPTNAGTYAVTADFIPTDTVNYNNLSDASAGNFVINKANSTTTITCPESVTYNGGAQTPCTGEVTGAGGLSIVPVLNYSNNTNVGSANANYTFTGDTNHNGSSDSENFSIAKANAIIDVSGFSGVYDGNSHGLTGTATGILDEALAGLDLGISYTNVSSNTVTWTFTDVTGNYNDATGSQNIDITQKDLHVTVTGVNKIFDGNANATVILGSEDIIGDDNVLLSYTDALFDSPDAGANKPITVGTISMSGISAPNYNLVTTSITVEDEVTADISPEAASITLSGMMDVTYDGDTHTLEASTDPEELSYVILYNGLTNLPKNVGEYDVLALITDPDYAGQDTATLAINPLPITVTVDGGQGKVYGEDDPEFTYQITGENTLLEGDELSGSLTRDTGEDVGLYDINLGTLGNTNYEINFVGGTFTISKADQTITFNELEDKTIGDSDFDLNATASSEEEVVYSVEEGSTCSLTGEGNTTVHLLAIGTCTITASQAGNENYNEAPEVTRSFEIAALTHKITASSGANGSVSPVGETTVANGGSRTYSIDANNGFDVENVIIDGEVSVGPVTTYTFNEVTTDHTISATFKEEVREENTSGSIPNNGRVLGASTEKGQVLGAEKFIFTEYMKLGSKDGEVDELQKFLNDAGYDCGAVDGIFGTKTDACVRAFQKANPPLKIDGIVGPLTRAVLNK